VVYDLDRDEFLRTRDELMALLELGGLVSQPSRKLVDLRWVLAAVALTAAVLWVTSRLWHRELRNYAGALG
jgi:hypothetical protein